jgi:uncharacterized DUF497 family protein
MIDEMELEWDEAKRQQTLKERGLDFSLAAFILSDPDMRFKTLLYAARKKNKSNINS